MEVSFQNQILKHNFKPKYLGVILDRSLTYKEHLEKLSMKLRTRLNIIRMLAGTEWGASPDTLRISTLSLMYNTMNYSSPVWINSAHTNKIDTQINAALRVISATLKGTALQWLYVICNIAPPGLLRIKQYKNTIENSILYENSVLYNVLEDPVIHRLRSRITWDTFFNNIKNFKLDVEWRLAWENDQVVNSHLINDPTSKVPGFNLTRISWKNLNRIRSNCGRCNYNLHKWNIIDNKDCPCGATEQTIGHIICFCPNTYFEGDIFELHNAKTERAMLYLENLTVNL